MMWRCTGSMVDIAVGMVNIGGFGHIVDTNAHRRMFLQRIAQGYLWQQSQYGLIYQLQLTLLYGYHLGR